MSCFGTRQEEGIDMRGADNINGTVLYMKLERWHPHAHALVAVFAACQGVPLFSSDIKSSYFQVLPLAARWVTGCRPSTSLWTL